MEPNLTLENVTTESQLAEVNHVWSQVYGFTADDVDLATTKHFYLGRVDGEPAFGVSVPEYQIQVRGKSVKSAAVGAVGVLGRFRNSGAGTRFMRLLDQELQKQEFDLGLLYGFREPFYRRVGYEHCGWRWKVQCPAHRMPNLAQELPVHQVDPEKAAEVLDGCYSKFIQGFSGSTRRTPKLWEKRLGRKPPVIYALGDPVEAYFWCDIPGFWDNLEIGEFAWSTDRGYRSALALIRGLVINKTSATWCEPDPSPFLNFYLDQGVTGEVNRPTMFRVVRPDAFMSLFVDHLTFGLDLHITHLDGVAGDTTLKLNGGGSEVSLSVQSLAQGMLGAPSFESLRNNGRIEGAPDAVQTLIDSFPACPVTCMEFF